jgi:hypothetical protein
MSTTTVTGEITDPTGAPIAGAAVTAALVSEQGAYLADDTAEILSRASTTTATNGTWSLALTPNSEINPAGTGYRVTRLVDGRSQVNTITVPVSVSSVAFADRVTDASVAGGLAAGGVLSGYYPDPTFADTDVTTFAGLSPTNDDVLQRKSGAWANRTITQLAADLDDLLTARAITFAPTLTTIFQDPSYVQSGLRVVGYGAGGVIYMAATVGSTLRRSSDNGTNQPSVGVPSGVASAASCQQLYEWSGYVYGIFQDAGDSGYKLYRAAITTGSTALTWSTALFTLTTGGLGFGYTISGTTQALVVGEYGDPLVTATPAASLWRTTNGTTWSKVKTYGAAYRHVHCVAADPYNDGTIWVSTGDSVANCYSISTDHGATWSDLTVAASWQGTQISFSPDWVFVAPDAVTNASLIIFDRTTRTPRVGAATSHRSLKIRNEGCYANGSTTSSSTTFTTGNPDFASVFSGDDIGRKIIGSNIPNGTTVSSVNNSASVVLSAAATATATPTTWAIARNERPLTGCYIGAVDPATGIYYGVANADGSSGAPASRGRPILFAVPYPGAPCVHLADLQIAGSSVLFSNGQAWCGQAYVQQIAAPYRN